MKGPVIMIFLLTQKVCTKCHSSNIFKNGTNYKGKQKFHCHDCGVYGTLGTGCYRQERKREVIASCFERATPSAMRGVQRTFGVARQTLAPHRDSSPRAIVQSNHRRSVGRQYFLGRGIQGWALMTNFTLLE